MTTRNVIPEQVEIATGKHTDTHGATFREQPEEANNRRPLADYGSRWGDFCRVVRR